MKRIAFFFICFWGYCVYSYAGNHNMHPLWQIDYVKSQVQAKQEPYYTAYRQMMAYADSILNVPHHALINFSVPGFYVKPEEHRSNSLSLQQDAFAAYCSALAYALSGEDKYGKKACYFLNAWAFANKGYSEHDGVLVMTYSGSGLLIAAELMQDSGLWGQEEKVDFRKWVKYVYRNASNTIRVHKNNWADWGRFGSLLAASFLDEPEDIAENIRLIKSDLFTKIANDGSMPEETRRGDNGIWYTYFSLTPMTAACWIVYNQTGENLFELTQDNTSIRKALDYLAYYNKHPKEWKWHNAPNTGEKDIWPDNLLEAMAGIYRSDEYREYVLPKRPLIYPKHHFAWVFPTLMPVKL